MLAIKDVRQQEATCILANKDTRQRELYASKGCLHPGNQGCEAVGAACIKETKNTRQQGSYAPQQPRMQTGGVCLHLGNQGYQAAGAVCILETIDANSWGHMHSSSKKHQEAGATCMLATEDARWQVVCNQRCTVDIYMLVPSNSSQQGMQMLHKQNILQGLLLPQQDPIQNHTSRPRAPGAAGTESLDLRLSYSAIVNGVRLP